MKIGSVKRFISGALTIALLATSAAAPVYADDSTEEAIELSTKEEEAVEELSTEEEEVVEELSTEVIEEEQPTEDAKEEATEEDSIEEATTSAIDDEIIEVETDTKTARNVRKCAGVQKLVVGKTYTVKLGKNEEYWFNNVPASTDKDTYYAVCTNASGADYEKTGDINAFVIEGTWSDYWSMADADAAGMTKGSISFSDASACVEIKKSSKVGSACIQSDESVTLNFTVVRQPTIKPDESKMNVVPDADGGMTIYWECPSDADGVGIQFGTTFGFGAYEGYVDKSTTSMHFNADELKITSFLRITPAVCPDGYTIYNNDKVAEVNGSSAVKLTTPDKPTVKKDGLYVKINDGDTKNVCFYDANGKEVEWGFNSRTKIYYDKDKKEFFLGNYVGEKVTIKLCDGTTVRDSHNNYVYLCKYSKPVSVTIKLSKPPVENYDGEFFISYVYGSDYCTEYNAIDYWQVQYKVGANGEWSKSKKITCDSNNGYKASKNPGVYYYRARAVKKTSTGDTAKSSWSKSLKITVKPNKVKGVVTSSPKAKQVKVSWTKQSKVTGYEIYCSTSKDGKYRKVATVKDKSYITFKNKMTYKVNDTKKTIKLKFGKTYYYKVRAFKSVKNSNGKTKKIYGSYSRVVKASVR